VIDGSPTMLQAYLAFASCWWRSPLRWPASAAGGDGGDGTQMRHLALTDALTGLANRRWGRGAAAAGAARARSATAALRLIMVDIDHFKQLNDTLRARSRRRGAHRPRQAAERAGARHGPGRPLGWRGVPAAGARDATRGRAEVGRDRAAAGGRGRRFAEGFVLTISLGVASYRPGDTAPSLDRARRRRALPRQAGGRDRVRRIVATAARDRRSRRSPRRRVRDQNPCRSASGAMRSRDLGVIVILSGHGG
jgi:hypothetical protein